MLFASGSVHVALQGGPGRSCHHSLPPSLLLTCPFTIRYHCESPHGNQRLHLDRGGGGALGSYCPVSRLDQTGLQLASAHLPQ